MWDEEFKRYADFDYSLAVLEGALAKKIDTLRRLDGDLLNVAVVGYESMWRMEEEISKWQPDFIILDESHRIKTHNTKASKAAHRLGGKAKYRLALTGTPLTNKALDLFSQFKFLNPSIFGASFYGFRNRYFNMVGYGNYTPVLKHSMESELTRKTHSISFRAKKSECLDLPPTIDITRFVHLEKSATKLYCDIVKDSFAELNGQNITTTNVLIRLLRLSQLTGGFLGGDDNPKPQAVSKPCLK